MRLFVGTQRAPPAVFPVSAAVILLMSVLLLVAFPQRVLSMISQPPKNKFGGGAGVGRLVFDESAGQPGAWKCHYDMVLVERIQGKPKKESGLFVPDDDLPRLHLCRVLNVGPGREEENGRIAPMPPIKVGDVVIAKNPWGIGPKDEETLDGKKISYMRAQDVAAVLTGGKGLLPEG